MLVEEKMDPNLVVHNAPSCTCSRMVWLGNHCEAFQLALAEKPHKSMITATLAEVAVKADFDIDDLREVVGEVFWQIWHSWTPAAGIKVE
ncbi:hypothetical protein SC171_27985 [Pantoea cypripedii]|uniref:hypothetical protein n=1 Tax=Pantoea cypripedii TaxID=55209 RepID=UPI002FC69963